MWCAICQEEEPSASNLGTLSCGHQFHNACIIRALELDSRCPLCRNDPRANNEGDAPAADANGPARYTVASALTEAITHLSDDVRTRNSLITASRWRREQNRVEREMRTIQRTVRPARRLMELQIEMSSKRKRDSFEERYRQQIDELKRLSALRDRAKRGRRACYVRIASRYGYASET